MKQKITMKDKPQLSDEEIEHFMNFEGVIKKHGEKLILQKWYTRLLWISSAAIFTSVSAWYIIKHNEQSSITEKVDSKLTETETLQAPKNELSVKTTDTDTSLKSLEKEVTKKVETSTKPTIETKPVKETIDITVVEPIYIQAEPINGFPELYNYLNANLIYPPESLKDSLQGVQVVSFIINVNGKPEKIQIHNSLGQPFEKETIRLIESMPLWKPATLNGKAVPSKISLPLTFKIYKN
jgi:TonB family protein